LQATNTHCGGVDDGNVHVTLLFVIGPVTIPVLVMLYRADSMPVSVMLGTASHSKHTRSSLFKPDASPVKVRVKFAGTCTAEVSCSPGLTIVDI